MPAKRPACVGIFWFFRGRLLKAATPVRAGVRTEHAVNGLHNHVRYWPEIQRERRELRSVEYEEIPRGRVLFWRTSKRFRVYMDATLHRPVVKRAVLAAFALPEHRTRFLPDPHYTTKAAALERLFRSDD